MKQKNKTEQIIHKLSSEERMRILANRLIDMILEKHNNKSKMSLKELNNKFIEAKYE